jgi:uncharacterized protein (TIGR03086 family)
MKGLTKMSKNTDTPWPVLESGHQVLRSAVKGVDAKGWALSSPCEDWTVTQVLQHAAGDQLAFVLAITGGGGPSENPFSPSGAIDGDPITFLETALEAAIDAWGTIAADADTAPTPLPQGALAPWIGVGACSLDAAVHGWDIAKATGQSSLLDVDLARSLHKAATEIVEPLREYGAYGPALEAEAGDNEIDALLRYLGRQPEWAR